MHSVVGRYFQGLLGKGWGKSRGFAEQDLSESLPQPSKGLKQHSVPSFFLFYICLSYLELSNSLLRNDFLGN